MTHTASHHRDDYGTEDPAGTRGHHDATTPVGTGQRAEEVRQAPHPYVRYGITTGAVGAFVVAFYFLVLDALAGHPLTTPSALGATLFLGEPFDLNRTPSFLLVIGYTAVHGALFVAVASVASTLLLGSQRLAPGFPPLAGLLAAAFFLALTLTFLGFAAVFDIGIWNELGGGQVLIANALAASAMALALGRALREGLESRGSGAERRGEAP